MLERWTLAGIACFAVTACEYSYKKPGTGDAAPQATATAPPPKSEDLAAIRADALAQMSDPFRPFGRKEYVVTDPSFVDPCILDILHNSYGYDGGIPSDGTLRKSLVAHTEICWREKLGSDAGFTLIAPLVKDRYEHPVITKNGDKVTIDMGVVPGRVSRFRGTWKIYDSPVVDTYGDWKTPEAVRFFKMAIAKEPSAGRYEALLDNGAGADGSRKYLYDRKADLIQLTSFGRGSGVFQSEALHGDVGNVKSLARSDMKATSSTFALP
ncbi:MAG TPA: hypothetical protein VIF62_30985 [Labilithrix sp.]|jgi:hypothetical protein